MGLAVGRDDALVAAPGRFYFDVLRGGDDGAQSGVLLVGEEARAVVQGAARLEQRVAGQAAVREGVLLHRVAQPRGGVGDLPSSAGVDHACGDVVDHPQRHIVFDIDRIHTDQE